MVQTELTRRVSQAQSIKPLAARTTSTNGATVDLRGFDSATALFDVGTITDGTHTPKLEDSPDDSVWTEVAAANLVGSLAALATDTPQKVGYVGSQRYLRAVVTVTGGPSTGGVYSAQILRGHAGKSPP